MKKAAAIFCFVVLLFGLGGCTATQHDDIYNMPQELARKDAYSVVKFFGNTEPDGGYSFSISSISGARTIWNYTAAEGEEVTLRCTLAETGGGTAKFVLVDPDDNVTTLVEVSSAANEVDHSFTAKPGRYRAKVVGAEGAATEGQLQYSHGAVGAE